MIEIEGFTQVTVSGLEPAIFQDVRSAGPDAESTIRFTIAGETLQDYASGVDFLVEFLRQNDGGFIAHVPALPSASTQGENLEVAMMAVQENLAGILASEGEGLIVPPERREYLASSQDHVDVVTIRRDAAA